MEKETEFDMDIEIIDVYELNGQLRVEVEHAYGKQNIGLSLSEKYLDPYTEKPKWMKSVKQMLTKQWKPENKIRKEVPNNFIGTSMSLKDIPSGKVPGTIKRMVSVVGLTKKEAEEVNIVYPKLSQLRIDVMDDKILPFSKSVNDKLEKYYGGTGLGFDSDNRPEIIKLKEDGLMDSKGRPTELMPDKQAGRKSEKKVK